MHTYTEKTKEKDGGGNLIPTLEILSFIKMY